MNRSFPGGVDELNACSSKCTTQLFFGQVRANLPDSDIAKIVSRTAGYSGSDMKNLIQEASQASTQPPWFLHENSRKRFCRSCCCKKGKEMVEKSRQGMLLILRGYCLVSTASGGTLCPILGLNSMH